jgi:hypothetical protein
MDAMGAKKKKRPPASLFAMGYAELPGEVEAQGVRWRFSKLFKHDFFAATALYAREGAPEELAVLKIQRTYPLYGFPMKWLGRKVANHEIRIYEKLQGVAGIPAVLGRVGETGFLHAFVPGEDLHSDLPLTPVFFEQLRELFEALHARHIAYVDSNKRENILYGADGRPWLIDFQISLENKKGEGDNFVAKWLLRKFVKADWYHYYKHKTRLLPGACTPEEFEKARKRGLLHSLHRLIARPIIQVRRKFLSRYDLAKTR